MKRFASTGSPSLNRTQSVALRFRPYVYANFFNIPEFGIKKTFLHTSSFRSSLQKKKRENEYRYFFSEYSCRYLLLLIPILFVISLHKKNENTKFICHFSSKPAEGQNSYSWCGSLKNTRDTTLLLTHIFSKPNQSHSLYSWYGSPPQYQLLAIID